MRDVRVTLPRSLLTGIGVVTLLYVLAICSFEAALGHRGLADSPSAAADIARLSFGQAGSAFISALVCVTCLANINATLLTNSRIFFAFGRRWQIFRWFGVWNGAQNAPVNALLAQAAVTIGMIFALAAGTDSFTRLVVFSAPVFWLFFLMVAVALFLLRLKPSDSNDGFVVPLYPLVPIAFCLICVYMLYASTRYAVSMFGSEAAVVLVLLIAGVIGAKVAR